MNVTASNKNKSEADEADTPHPDERQIELDTDRSFVLYPVGEPTPTPPLVFMTLRIPSCLKKGETHNKDDLQSSLNALLVALFRKRPKLSYFQVLIAVCFFSLRILMRRVGIPRHSNSTLFNSSSGPATPMRREIESSPRPRLNGRRSRACSWSLTVRLPFPTLSLPFSLPFPSLPHLLTNPLQSNPKSPPPC